MTSDLLLFCVCPSYFRVENVKKKKFVMGGAVKSAWNTRRIKQAKNSYAFVCYICIAHVIIAGYILFWNFNLQSHTCWSLYYITMYQQSEKELCLNTNGSRTVQYNYR